MERLITEGKVGGAGLSDLNPPTFFNIYEAAEIKPTSVQVTSPEQSNNFTKTSKTQN